jgi:hypothetical protein
MKSFPSLAVLVSLSALLVSACGSDNGSSSTSTSAVPAAAASALADRGASGKALANGWFSLLEATGSGTGTITATPEQIRAGSELVKPYLDPAFQLQRASGQRYLASDYVPSDIGEFKISNVVVTEPTDEIKVVRYSVSTPGATTPDSGELLSSKVSPRISVFRWSEDRGHWVISSTANFNTPVAAICGQAPVKETKEQPTTSAEDVATGEELVSQWRDITLGKSKKSVLDPQNQIQLADGQGWPNPDGSKIKWSPASAYEPEDIVITRGGDLLVASYAAVESGLAIEGSTYGKSASPRLLTYRLNDQNEWKLIALANFNSPTEVPKGVDCAKDAG